MQVQWAGQAAVILLAGVPPQKKVKMRPQGPSCPQPPVTVSTGSSGNFLRRKVLDLKPFEKL